MTNKSNETPAILLAGGSQINEETFEIIFGPAFKKNPTPRVAYIGAANGDKPAFFEMLSVFLPKAGASSVDFVKLAREDADVEAARETLLRADIIFLSGGEVEDGINWIKKHGLTVLLREQYAAGKQFIGVSAGTIMMGAYWVRWDVPEDNDTAELFKCLGLIPVTFDTHGEDEDWIELKTALSLMGDGARGYGLPRGGVINADSLGNLVNIEKEYLTFKYINGKFEIT
jgi:dipeptidase E